MTTDRNHDTSPAEALDAALPARTGVANRRAFLMGGVVLAGGAVLAACGKEDAQTPKTGALPVQPSTTTTTAPGSAANDRVLLQTSQSIELLAVETYQTLLDGDLVTDSSVTEIFELFQAHHQEHADALTDAIREAGGTTVTSPNEFLATGVIEPAVAELTDQTTAVTLARELENIATQTYTEFGKLFSTPELRQFGLSIGEIDARHITVLNLTLGYTAVPVPFISTGSAIDPKGYVS